MGISLRILYIEGVQETGLFKLKLFLTSHPAMHFCIQLTTSLIILPTCLRLSIPDSPVNDCRQFYKCK